MSHRWVLASHEQERVAVMERGLLWLLQAARSLRLERLQNQLPVLLLWREVGLRLRVRSRAL